MGAIKTIGALFFAIGAIAQYFESRALSQTLRDIEHCEEREIKIHEQINEFTNQGGFRPDDSRHSAHLDALHRWLRQWQRRKITFDKRI